MAQVAEVKLRAPSRAIALAGDVLVEHATSEESLLIEQYLNGVGDRHGCWDTLVMIGERVSSALYDGHKEAHSLEWLASLQTRVALILRSSPRPTNR